MFANGLDQSDYGLGQLAKALALLIRLPNSLTAVSNIVAAHVIVTMANPQWLPLLVTLLASLCFYHGGMVLNDCFDYQEDKQARPARPLPAAIISLTTAWRFGFILLLTGLLFAFSLGLLTFLIGCVLVAAILLYNLSPRDGVAGCVAMGCCRVLNWCLGLAVANELIVYWPYAVLVGVYVTALTMISRDETDANNPRWLVYCACLIVSGALFFILFMFLQKTLSIVGGAVLLSGLLIIIYRLIKLKHDYNPTAIQATVMFLVLGLIPLDAALVVIAGYPVAAVFIALLLVPSRILARRLYVT